MLDKEGIDFVVGSFFDNVDGSHSFVPVFLKLVVDTC